MEVGRKVEDGQNNNMYPGQAFAGPTPYMKDCCCTQKSQARTDDAGEMHGESWLGERCKDEAVPKSAHL